MIDDDDGNRKGTERGQDYFLVVPFFAPFCLFGRNDDCWSLMNRNHDINHHYHQHFHHPHLHHHHHHHHHHSTVMVILTIMLLIKMVGDAKTVQGVRRCQKVTRRVKSSD